MHTSLAQCAGLLAPCADRRAARACRQVAAPDKSCELGDRDGGEDAGKRAADSPAPAPRRVTQVSPSVTLTACAMFAGRSHAQVRDVLGAGRRRSEQQQECSGEQQRAPDGHRRRCGPVARDRVIKAANGRQRRPQGGSQADSSESAPWPLRHSLLLDPAAPVRGRTLWHLGRSAAAPRACAIHLRISYPAICTV